MPGYAIIKYMDSQNGGQFSGSPQQRQSDAQRQTAASIARRRVLEAYGGQGQNNVANATSATRGDFGGDNGNRGGNFAGNGNVANATFAEYRC